MNESVALVNMPWASVNWPSLGLSLLKAGLAKQGIPSRVYYLNLWFAEYLDHQTQQRMINGWPMNSVLVGEWVFSAALSGIDVQRDRTYLDEVFKPAVQLIEPAWSEEEIDRSIMPIVACRSYVEQFLERCLKDVPWHQYRLVGFTSLFQQQLAALALARRLKEAHPHLYLVFGGANCEGPMGRAMLRTFGFIDAVCSGEGDLVFPEMVQRVLTDKPIGHLPGILHRQLVNQSVRADVDIDLAPTVEDMDALPYPDFDDYFRDLAKGAWQEAPSPRLMFETSRGCWWGQKAHCTFCGLNGSTMAFRQKSADRAIAELTWMIERYGKYTRRLSAVDNILPFDYMKTFLPRLQKLDLGLELFYETKANLRKEQIALFSSIGMVEIQPGIESLSSPVLRLMRKGVSGLQNIQLLKWCCQFGVSPSWNYLIGFPGERAEDYADQAELIRSIPHLPPPQAWGRIRFDRFSPYLTQSVQLGVKNLRPYPAYHFLYPDLAENDLFDLAYYFVGEFDGQDEIDIYTAAVQEALNNWISRHEESALFSYATESELVIVDLRHACANDVVILTGLPRAVLEACDAICCRANLQKCLEAAGLLDDASTIDNALLALLKRKFLVQEEDRYLSLVVPLGYKYAPGRAVLDHLSELGMQAHPEPLIRSPPVDQALASC